MHHELHIEYGDGWAEVWAVFLDCPVEVVPCRTGAEITAAVRRLTTKYRIGEDDEEAEPFSSEEVFQEELRRLSGQAAARERYREVRRRVKERLRQEYQDWLDRTSV